MSRLESLPADVLKLVMQHLSLKDRLTSCCLVSKRLHAAAVAATHQVELRTDRVQPGLNWMSQYGNCVTNIDLNLFKQPLQQLPCPNLLELKLCLCSIQLGPTADGQPGVVQGCTKLTRLDMRCNLIDAPAGAVVDSLSSLVHLQHLSLLPRTVEWHDHVFVPAATNSLSIGGLSSETLPRLTCLTYLDVRSLSALNLAQLGGLTNLKEFSAACLAADEDGFAVSPSSVPGFAFPSSLTKLDLDLNVEAGILSLLPDGLKHLHMSECRVEGPAEGPGSMLFYLARLQQLTRLELYLEDDWPPAGPAYSALTASGTLAALAVGDATLPTGIWPHVFPSTRQMLHLTHLWFSDDSVWDATDMSRLVSSCPNLRTLEGLTLEHGLHVSELHKLTAMRSMMVSYAADGLEGIGEFAKGMAALTQLQRLVVDLHSQELCPVSSLLPLTSLTALTALGWGGGLESLLLHSQVSNPTAVCETPVTCATGSLALGILSLSRAGLS